MKTFPKPLTAEDEKYYLQRHEEGDKKARQILIEYNLRLVAHIAKKYQTTEDDMEELISIGTVGLIKAVDTFDHEKASKLATYAARCVENEILMYMRVKKKLQRESSYYEPIGTDKEGNEITRIGGYIDRVNAGEIAQLNASATSDFANAYDFEIVKM